MCGNSTQRRRPALFSRDQFRSWPFIAHSRIASAWLTSCLVPPWANLMPSSEMLDCDQSTGRVAWSSTRFGKGRWSRVSNNRDAYERPGPSMTTTSPLFIKSYYLKSQVALGCRWLVYPHTGEKRDSYKTWINTTIIKHPFLPHPSWLPRRFTSQGGNYNWGWLMYKNVFLSDKNHSIDFGVILSDSSAYGVAFTIWLDNDRIAISTTDCMTPGATLSSLCTLKITLIMARGIKIHGPREMNADELSGRLSYFLTMSDI